MIKRKKIILTVIIVLLIVFAFQLQSNINKSKNWPVFTEKNEEIFVDQNSSMDISLDRIIDFSMPVNADKIIIEKINTLNLGPQEGYLYITKGESTIAVTFNYEVLP